jgi:dGTPase
MLASPGGRADLAAYTADLYSADAAEVEAALARLVAQHWWGTPSPESVVGLAALRTMTSELVGRFAAAARTATRERFGPGPLRRYQADLVVPAPVRAECLALKGVAWYFVIGLRSGDARRARQREILLELVELIAASAPEALEPLLRPAWRAALDDAARLRIVIDQVARYTDASATRRHAELLGRPGWVGLLDELRSAAPPPAAGPAPVGAQDGGLAGPPAREAAGDPPADGPDDGRRA